MKENTKDKGINRKKVLKYFQDSFNAAGIKVDVTQNFEKNQSVMKELVEHLVEFGLPGPHAIPNDATYKQQEGKIDDYSKYLRNILGTARKADSETMGFKYELMESVIEFPKRCTTTLDSEILYSPKKYALLNFWRTPQIGKIVRRNNALFFEGAQDHIELRKIKGVQSVKMPRDRKVRWLEVNLENRVIYLAKFSTTEHQLNPSDDLRNLLKNAY